MNVNVQFRDDGHIIRGLIEGEIDTHTAPILRGELDALRVEDGMLIELNLSKISYMDSTGLGIFVALYKKVTKKNAQLKLIGLTNRLVRLFDITGLSDLMDIESDKKEGLTNESV